MVFLRNHSINSNCPRTQLPISSLELSLLNTSLQPCSNSIGSRSNPALNSRFYSSLSRSFITWHHHISLNSIHIHTLSRTLWSSSTIQLFAPSAKLTTMGSQAFGRSASSLWNSLPPDIHTSNTVSTFKSPENTLIPSSLLCIRLII